jgi:hypothetical protein
MKVDVPVNQHVFLGTCIRRIQVVVVKWECLHTLDALQDFRNMSCSHSGMFRKVLDVWHSTQNYGSST